MALCNDGHGSARRHRDLNGGGERFERQSPTLPARRFRSKFVFPVGSLFRLRVSLHLDHAAFPAPASSNAACGFPASSRSPAVSGLNPQNRQDVSAFALTYILRLRSCKSMDAFVISSLPSLWPETLQTAGPLRSHGPVLAGRRRRHERTASTQPSSTSRGLR